jgi:hypothetical protein
MAANTNIKATTDLSNWRFWDQHVQNDMPGGNFINAATVLVAAGPPRLSQTGTAAATDVTADINLDQTTNIAFPIGVIENFGLNQNRMIQKLFEIGSKRAYHIPGRTVGTVTLGRILYWGPSLMRVMYAYYPHTKILGANGLDKVERELGTNGRNTPQILDTPGYGSDDEKVETVEPENSDFFINLASDLFDHPLGLMVYLRDAENEPYGAFYLEDTYIQAHSFNINASSVLVAEGVSCQYDRLVPVNIRSAVENSSARRVSTGLGL